MFMIIVTTCKNHISIQYEHIFNDSSFICMTTTGKSANFRFPAKHNIVAVAQLSGSLKVKQISTLTSTCTVNKYVIYNGQHIALNI